MAKQPTFALRFPPCEIGRWAREYGDPQQDAAVIEAGHAARERGWLTKDELVTICAWKSPRPRPHVARNPDEVVHEVTGVALSARCEHLRIGALTLLAGVSIRTASAILHLAHRDDYPLIDVRALWSLSAEEADPDEFFVWLGYVEACRAIATKAKVDMRTLDRALWGYSKRHQQ
jgi:hypothetical protein